MQTTLKSCAEPLGRAFGPGCPQEELVHKTGAAVLCYKLRNLRPPQRLIQHSTMTFSREPDSERPSVPPLTVVESPSLVRVVASEPEAPEEERAARVRLAQLRQEHRDLDAAIDALLASGNPDQLQLTRMKKRKLSLRDLITKIEDELLPDIIA